MTINVYQRGDLVRCAGAFANAAGTPIDPAVVRFEFTAPDGVVTTYTYGTDAQLVRDSLGIFRVDLNATARGTWLYRWFSTGTGQAAEHGEFTVEPG